MSIIISEFHFFQVKRKLLFGDTMEFDNAFLGITPEAFKAVDIHFARGKSLAMINP